MAPRITLFYFDLAVKGCLPMFYEWHGNLETLTLDKMKIVYMYNVLCKCSNIYMTKQIFIPIDNCR